MATWSVLLNFDDGYGDRDITALVDKYSFRRDRKLYGDDFQCFQSTCRFSMRRDTVIVNKLLTATDAVTCTITKDAAPYFVGTVRRNFDIKVRSNIAAVNIEIIDLSENLKKRITTSFAYGGFKVYDSADPDNSIVYQLLSMAGLDPSDVVSADITKTVDYLVNIGYDSKATYFDVLQKILFEFGYVFYFDGAGNFCTYNFLPASLSSAFTFTSGPGGNMIGELGIKKTLAKYEGAKITWWLTETLTAAVLFNDTTGGTASAACSIPLASGEYYPTSSEIGNVFSEFKVDDRELIYADSTVLDLVGSGGIHLETLTAYYRRAILSIHNNGAAGVISRLKITGRAVVKGDMHKTIRLTIADTEKIRDYQAEFIRTEADALKLAVGLAQHDEYSPFEYKVRSREALALGAVGDIEETHNLGIDNQVRVIAITEYEGTGLTDYLMEGVAAYSAASVDTEATHRQPVAIQPPQTAGMTDGLTDQIYSSIIGGFNAGGGTTTPTAPTINVCKSAGARGIHLQWTRQLNLTNFDRYEVQVSADQSDWYDLAFDGLGAGTGWGVTLDAVTAWVSEVLTHSNIPLGGSSSAPTSVCLYYRVRTRTKAPESSAWSSTAFAWAYPVRPGELAENTIYANNIIAAEIVALLVRASELYIGFTSFAGGTTWDAPGEGDRINYQNGTTVEFLEYTDGAWTVTNGIKIGFFIGAIFANVIACGGITHPDNPPASAECLPHSSFRVFNFENNYQDQNGVDDWVNKATLAFSTTWKMFGSYSLFATAGNGGYLGGPAGGAVGSDQSFSAYFNYAKSGTSTVTGTPHLFVLTTTIGGNENSIAIIDKQTNGSGDISLQVRVCKNGVDVLTYTTFATIASSGIYYLALSYKSSTDTLYLVINNSITTFPSLGGSWGSGSWDYLQIKTANAYVVNGITRTIYADELVYTFNKYVAPELYAQHYTHNVAWVTDRAKNDILLRPGVDGRAMLYREAGDTTQVLTWHKVAAPTAGWFASKTSGWTADRFTAASGGLAVDFSSVVSPGTKSVRVVIQNSSDPSYAVYARPAGDDTYASNTPIANSEWFTILNDGPAGSNSWQMAVEVMLNDSYVAEFAVGSTSIDLYVSYPLKELR